MEKSATLNLRVNPAVKQRAEDVLSKLGIPMSTAVDMYLNQISLTGGIPFAVTLPKAPASINADLMTDDELHDKLQKGYEDMQTDRVQNAAEAFAKFRENHQIKSYIVEITDEALRDIEELYNYIALNLQSPGNAMSQYNRIADAITTLDSLAERFRVMESEPEHSRKIRRMLIDNYSVFFVIEENRVTVTDVLYSASDIEKRLKQ